MKCGCGVWANGRVTRGYHFGLLALWTGARRVLPQRGACCRSAVHRWPTPTGWRPPSARGSSWSGRSTSGSRTDCRGGAGAGVGPRDYAWEMEVAMRVLQVAVAYTLCYRVQDSLLDVSP